MFPTVRDVLDLEPVRHGAPRVVAGESGLDLPVRWVHVVEIPDIAHLLRGGELVLTTGIALPEDTPGLRRWIGELAEVGAAGVIVELGRRFVTTLPKPLVAAAARHGLPLVELGRETPFVRITEAVHAQIVDAQLAELRLTEQIHQRFTALSVDGATAAEVVREAAQLASGPVVLENLARQVLAYETLGQNAELLLDGWEAFSRGLRMPNRTSFDAPSGWLATAVGARGQDWGRLLLRCVAEPLPRLSILLERAAATLALNRLVHRDQEGLVRQVHGTLLAALINGDRPGSEVAVRANALGVPLAKRYLVGVALRLLGPEADGAVVAQSRLRDLTERVGSALGDAGLIGLCGAIDETSIGALLSLGSAAEETKALTNLAAAVHRRAERGGSAVVIGVGSGVGDLREARRSLQEAGHVAEVASTAGATAPFYRLPDVGLRGFLHLLRSDTRLHTFVERELGALLVYQAKHPKENLLGPLRAFLANSQNKTLAAKQARLSRPAFYERLDRIARILDADLHNSETCAALTVALLAHDTIRRA